MSYRAEVIADSTGKWSGNQLTFAFREDAAAYVRDLMYRWTSVKDTRVVEGDWPVTHWWNADVTRAEALS